MRLERPVFEQVHLRSKCTEKKRQRRGFEVTAFVENGRKQRVNARRPFSKSVRKDPRFAIHLYEVLKVSAFFQWPSGSVG